MKKRLLTLLLGIVMMFSVVGCSQSQSSESSKSEEKSTVTIKSLNGNKEEIDLEVPYDSQRIAVLDLAALDILDNLGVGDRVVGSADTSIDYLSSYSNNDKITNLGTIK